jgi:hypothetical protein
MSASKKTFYYALLQRVGHKPLKILQCDYAKKRVFNSCRKKQKTGILFCSGQHRFVLQACALKLSVHDIWNK